MEPIIPYVIVCGIAALIVAAELLRTFGGGCLRALRCKWTWVLFIVNLGLAALAYYVVRAAVDFGSDNMLALVVGLLSPALLRSRFTFFRAVGAEDDPRLSEISLRMDALYARLQQKCHQEVDTAMAVRRSLKAQQLAAQCPEAALVHNLRRLIGAQEPAAAATDENFLAEMLAGADEAARKFQLALFLMDLAAGAEDELLAGNV